MAIDWQAKRDALRVPRSAFINGKFLTLDAQKTFSVIDPARDVHIAEVQDCDAACVDEAVRAARTAFTSRCWADQDIEARKTVLYRFAELILAHAEELALLDSISMGKPINDALTMDIPGAAATVRWYAEAIDKGFDKIAPTNVNSLATITREPLGVVAAIVPWNYPLEMAMWKVAPALAVGNSVILKPAEQSPFSALRVAELASEAGFPEGVFNVLPGLGESTGQALGRHNDIDCLTFTGSTAVGKLFMRYSADSNLKQVWLECGGKSPNLIFADCAHLPLAIEKSLAGIFFNQGEVCSANSRLYVEESIYAEVVKQLVAQADAWQPSDPLNDNAAAGALISRRHAEWLEARIAEAEAKGAKLLCGGKALQINGKGTFFPPTIIAQSQQADFINQQELFGPVLSVQPFKDEAEAIALANDSIYGLAASLWTDNLHRAHRVAKRLHAGTVSVNTVDALGLTTPFGGVKQSGFGKDLSLLALDKFVATKTTWFEFL